MALITLAVTSWRCLCPSPSADEFTPRSWYEQKYVKTALVGPLSTMDNIGTFDVMLGYYCLAVFATTTF